MARLRGSMKKLLAFAVIAALSFLILSDTDIIPLVREKGEETYGTASPTLSGDTAGEALPGGAEGTGDTSLTVQAERLVSKTEESQSSDTCKDSEADQTGKTVKPLEIQGLVRLADLDDSFVIDLKYATADNFTGKIIYSKAVCLINKNTAKKLIAANNEFKKLGYRIKIFDAYRPYSAQKVLWDSASDKSYLANPKKGSVHNRGAAVDITLVDGKDRELDMPSAYDEFTKRARLDYTDCPKQQIENRELLGSIMKKHGFRRIKSEWWHFDDLEGLEYPLLDIPFEKFGE
jgi:D-alanyl-D-alanine dipeptidase